MAATELSRLKLLVMAVSRLGIFLGILFVAILGIAGSVSYWQAWMYMATLLVPMAFILGFLIIKDPALLARRMQFREKEAPQKLVIRLGVFLYVFIYLVPALDQRFGWSEVPSLASIIADVFVFIGYWTFVMVMRINSYAARTVEVVEGQELITTGLYALVRHPMYFGNILMYIATPIALASWWGLVPVLPFVAIMIYRIKNEEAVLLRELPGYAEYQLKTPYRLLPGIW